MEKLSLANVEGKVIDNFQILEKFSNGAFSVVHFAHHVPTKTYCVAKIIDLSLQSADEVAGSLHEISVFMQVSHPNIVSLIRFSYVEPLLFFFMEYLPNGTLLKYVTSKKGLDEIEARKMFIQLFSALRHLHLTHFLAHRDIKLENILLDKNHQVKLIDFGLASTFYNSSFKQIVGTPGYMPPEVMAGSEYGEKCDVWSLGISLYCMLTSFLPFSIQSRNVKRLLAECETFRPPKAASPLCGDLLMKMLSPRPDNRPTLLQLQRHPWMTGLPPITGPIIPSPIQFYQVKNFAAISKFKRHSVKPDSTLLNTCEQQYGINKEVLEKELAEGLVNDNTTTYFAIQVPQKTQPNLPELKASINVTVKEAPQPQPSKEKCKTPRLIKKKEPQPMPKRLGRIKPSKSSPPPNVRLSVFQLRPYVI
ncbi:CAMK family protein kinase [Tritrichomonas foetus]|uniref:CAMK family protein kinase n=1 Tax=Tritrichomonas foetus TaxID=1144522 RepID=A0A1J4K685_9EUKA|nr:CAMK family protein kinase [Tritrichomonas foetus]|eukprot:OHT06961.1 CAMK family protein kinase [Tritrichomonas foetus]